MRYRLNTEQIKTDLIKGKVFQHNAGQCINILPFRPDYNDEYYNFDEIIGEISRLSMGKTTSEEINQEKVIERIRHQVETSEIEVLLEFIQALYFDEKGNVEAFHPKVFAYKPLTESVKNHQKNIARFIYDVLINQEETRGFNNLYASEGDLMVGLMIKALPDLTDYKMKDKGYVIHEVVITKVFSQDLNLLLKDEKLFIKWFKELIMYYYFFYTAQTILKLNQRINRTEKSIPLYFLVGDEKGGRERMSSKQGFKLIKAANENTFANVMLCQFLNYNEYQTESYCFTEWYQHYVQEANEEEIEEAIISMEDFIEFYKEQIGDIGWGKLEINYGGIEKTIDRAVHKAYEHIKFQFVNGGRSAAAKKYENWFYKFAVANYTKSGGNLGYLLNIKEDLLLFLIGLTIQGKEKERLNIVFEELQVRGLWFDDYSKDYIVELLEKRNLLEKKSDSGDAKYVRAIL